MIPLRDSIPSSRAPVVNVLLIAANVAVFVYEWSLPRGLLENFVFRWGAVPANFLPGGDLPGSPVGALPTLATSMFLHGSPLHLLFNMLYLWIFGDNVEDRLGHVRYLFFYFACGVAAAATQVFLSLHSEVPMIGASGAIGGVMGAYLISFPRARVLTFFWFFIFIRFFWVPALLYLGIWFLMQLMAGLQGAGTLGGAQGGGVAVWAHVGGFAAGAVLVLLLRRSPRAAAPLAVGSDPWGRDRPARRSRYE